MTSTQRTVGALTIMVAFVVVVTAFALSALTDPASGEAAGLPGDDPGGPEIGDAAATAPGVTRTVTATQQLTIPAGVVRLTETPAPVTQTVATTGTVVRENVRTVTEQGAAERVTERVTERATVTQGATVTARETVTERVAGGGATITEVATEVVTEVVTETVPGPAETVVETVTETVQGAAPPPETVTVTQTVGGGSGE